MQDLKLVLSKYIVRRRLEGGEFSYVYRPSNQSVAGKKAALALLKGDTSAFDKLKEESEVTEAEEELESQLLKTIPQLPYEDDVKEEAMETEDNDRDGENEFNEPVPLLELKRTVFVRMFNPGPQTPEEKSKECESFLRGSDDSMVIKRLGHEAKSEKRKKNPKGFNYRLVFSTDAEAEKFCAQEHTFKEKQLFPRTSLQSKHRQRIRVLTFDSLRMTKIQVIVWLEKNQKDLSNYLFAIGKNTQDVIKDAASIKALVNSKSEKNTGVSFLVEYPDASSADKAVEALNGKDVSVISVKDFKDNLELAEEENNLGELGNVPDKKMVVIQPMDEGVIKNIFPSAVSIQKVKKNSLTIVEFKNANDAKKADAETVGLNCTSVVMMNKYFEMRKSVFQEPTYPRKIKMIKEVMEKGDVKIEIEDDKIIVEGEERKSPNQPKKETQKKEVKEAQAKVNEVKGKKSMKSKETQTKIDNKLVSKRKYQVGQTDWDPFVVCSNFVPKDKSLGSPNEDDIRKYFIHNHKNVVDVKFPRWNEKTAFVKFNSKDAADSFLELDYVMFFSTDLGRNIMGQYLKNKTHDQKNEVSMILLNKPYVFGTVVEEGNPFHVEFSGLKSQNEVLRSLFVNKLNLAEKDVGKMTWDTAGGVKARLNVKVPEAAVNHLIGRWNSMSVSVAGQVVSAEFWVPKGTKRHGDLLSKKEKKKNKQEGGPMVTHAGQGTWSM